MAIIKNEIDKRLQGYSPSRLTVTAVTINSIGSSFLKAKNTNTVSPSQIDLVPSIVGFTTPTYNWYYSTSTNLSTWVPISTGINLAITNTLYTTHLTPSTGNTFIRYKVVATQTGWATAETYFDINYNEEKNDVPVLTFTKDSIALPTTSLDICNYVGASTDISISIGGVALSYAATGANTFNVVVGTLTGTGVVTPSTTGNIQTYTISGMNSTGLTSTLSIPFTITARDSRNFATTFTKNVLVSKVASGSTAVFIDLLSESDVFPAANDGTGYGTIPANTVRLYNGGALVTATSYGCGTVAGTQTATVNGLTATVTVGTGSVAFSGTWTADSAIFTFNAVYAGTTYTTTYTLAKSRVGSDAVFIDLLSESDVFPAANDGTGYGTILANTVRIYKGGTLVTATSYGCGTVAGTQTATVNGLTATVTVGTGAIAFSGTWTTDSAIFTFNAVYAGTTYTTTYTLAKSRTGAVGSDAVFIDLLSESDVFPAANDGTGYGTILANTVRIYKGGTLVTATSYGCGLTAGTQTATVNGLTATVTVGTGAVAFSGTWTADSAVFTFNAVYAGTTYTTTYTLAKSRVGSDAVFIDLLSESDVFPAANDGTEYGTIPANTVRIYKGGALVTATSYGCGTVAGTQTATVNGLTATVTVGTGAIAFSGTWTTDSAIFTFNAVYAGITYTTTYTLAKSRTGAVGNDAVFIDLLSESDVFPAANDGTGYGTIPANTVRIYKGGTLVTATSYGCGLTAGTQTATVNGLTATVTVGTGAVAFSGTWTADSAIFTFNAVYAGATYTTTYTLAKSRVGSDAVFIDLLSESDVFPAANDGTGYGTIPANTIRIYKGGALVTATSYGCGALAGTQTATVNGLTATVTVGTGAIAFSGTWTTDSAVFTFNAVYAGTTYTTTYTLAKSKVGSKGDPGITGTKAVTVSCFRWLASAPTAGSWSGAATLTWPSTVSASATGWSPTATTNTTAGMVLYQLNITVSDTATATSTAFNWNSATLNSIGYNVDGSIGPQGDSARIAYTKSTIASPSGTTTSAGTSSLPATSSFGLTSAVFSASPPALTTAGEYLYQTDGVYVVSTGTITWQTPYLSNLKVGSLSAISANMGVVQIATAGNVYSGKTAYNTAADGFFLGNESGTPKFKIGNAADTKSLGWSGDNLAIKGDISGSSTINITGSGVFGGSTTTTTGLGSLSTAILANNAYVTAIGITGKALSNNDAVNAGIAVGVYGASEGSTGNSVGGYFSGTRGCQGVGDRLDNYGNSVGLAGSTAQTPTGVGYSVGVRAEVSSNTARSIALYVTTGTNTLAYPITIDFGRTTAPAETVNILGWIPIMVNGTSAHIPYYV